MEALAWVILVDSQPTVTPSVFHVAVAAAPRNLRRVVLMLNQCPSHLTASTWLAKVSRRMALCRSPTVSEQPATSYTMISTPVRSSARRLYHHTNFAEPPTRDVRGSFAGRYPGPIGLAYREPWYVPDVLSGGEIEGAGTS